MCTYVVPEHTTVWLWWSETTFRSMFLPSTMWILGTELKVLGLVASTFHLLNCLINLLRKILIFENKTMAREIAEQLRHWSRKQEDWSLHLQND